LENHLSKFSKDQAFVETHGRLLDKLQNSHDEAARTSTGMEDFRKKFRSNLIDDLAPEKIVDRRTPTVVDTSALENWREDG